jgi:hypothetical protein
MTFQFSLFIVFFPCPLPTLQGLRRLSKAHTIGHESRTASRAGMHHDALNISKTPPSQLWPAVVDHNSPPFHTRRLGVRGLMVADLAGVCRWQMPVKCQPNTSIIFQPFLPWNRSTAGTDLAKHICRCKHCIPPWKSCLSFLQIDFGSCVSRFFLPTIAGPRAA